jgi:hypothetical protein
MTICSDSVFLGLSEYATLYSRNILCKMGNDTVACRPIARQQPQNKQITAIVK